MQWKVKEKEKLWRCSPGKYINLKALWGPFSWNKFGGPGEVSPVPPPLSVGLIFGTVCIYRGRKQSRSYRCMMHEEREANIWPCSKRYIMQSVILFETVYMWSHRAKKAREWTGSAMCVWLCSKATCYQKSQNFAAAFRSLRIIMPIVAIQFLLSLSIWLFYFSP